MADPKNAFDEKLLVALKEIATNGVHKAATGFSTMLGQPLTVSQLNIRTISISDIPNILGGPEKEATGIYLKAEGVFTGQIMLIIPLDKAYEIVDMLMGNPIGTTTMLGSLERSALAEVGNLTTSFFLSVVENSTGSEARPSPPAVIVDMVGAIMDIVAATAGSISEQVLLFEAGFECGDRSLEANFWVVPDPATLESLSKRV
jgi:chemotaxis protein CheC